MNESLQQLINGCIKEDRLAQERLYRLFYPQLFLLCRRFFAADHAAIECLNDGMLKVYRAIGRFDTSQGLLFNWMYTIIRNTALDHLRRTKHIYSALAVVDNLPVPDLNPLEQLESTEVYRLLDVLPAATRAVCSLYYLENFHVAEIAEKLAVSAGTVKWHLSESRSRIRYAIRNHKKTKEAR